MEHFTLNDRLGIHIPSLKKEWDDYSEVVQQEILLNWERVRGRILDRIKVLEKKINKKLALLSDELDFKRSCELNSEIADLASIVNDLWIWFRKFEGISEKKKVVHK